MPPNDSASDTWNADFWNDRPARRTRRIRRRRPHLVSRARRIGATALVIGLAGAWIATAHAGGTHRSIASAGADATPAVAKRPLPHRERLPVTGTDGIRVSYRTMDLDSLRAAYLAALAPGLSGGSVTLGPGSGPPVCARGGEEERAWSRPAAPARAVGRYACRIEEGRAAMWWTVEDRGLLAHAVAPNADLGSLFAWWEAHSER